MNIISHSLIFIAFVSGGIVAASKNTFSLFSADNKALRGRRVLNEGDDDVHLNIDHLSDQFSAHIGNIMVRAMVKSNQRYFNRHHMFSFPWLLSFHFEKRILVSSKVLFLLQL